MCNYGYGVKNEYLDNYINLHEPKKCFLNMIKVDSLSKAGGYLWGYDPIFIASAKYFFTLFWISLGSCIIFSKSSKKILSFLLIVGSFFVALLFVLISGGTIPTRALLGLPVLYSFIPIIAFSKFNNIVKKGFLLIILYVLFSNITTVNLLFYTDHLSNIKDEVMGTQLIYEINRIAGDHFKGNIPVTVYGTWPHETMTNFKRVEIFGTSFFGFDGDTPYRMCCYLKILGCNYLNPSSITSVKEDINYISHQPNWPRAGSVFLLKDIVVIKLSNISYPQENKLKEIK